MTIVFFSYVAVMLSSDLKGWKDLSSHREAIFVIKKYKKWKVQMYTDAFKLLVHAPKVSLSQVDVKEVQKMS